VRHRQKPEVLDEITKRSIREISGVGEIRAKRLEKLGIHNIYDALTYYPREYEDRSRFKPIAQLENGDECSFIGTVSSQVSELKPRRGLSIQKVQISDSTGIITATWFNQNYLKKALKFGKSYVFYGQVKRNYGRLEVLNPVFEEQESGTLDKSLRIMPVYSCTQGLNQNFIRTVIKKSLGIFEGKLEEILPMWVRKKYFLSEINYSLMNIHFPENEEALKNSRYRLVFEELLLLQLGLLSFKNTMNSDAKGIVFKPVDSMGDFISSLPFSLTKAQENVCEEIFRDMESQKIMNRLVQGDVGSGKTIVAVLAIYKACKNGYQAAMMAPTEILAEQHFRTIEPLLEPFGINTELITGSCSKKKKKEILEKVSEGAIDLLIGTHALIEEKVAFSKLGLVVTDEQHRFGVRQRALLSKKGDNPDMIVMTATPIPRTLALILYGDLDISIINELPPGRRPVKTYAVDESMRERINAFLRKKVSEGRQVFIVCPLIEESDAIEAKSAMELFERISKTDFSDLRVGVVHGKMSSKEKDAVMKDFIEAKLDILVSTTVIEVGVNIPNATIMVIENAERFGLAQLHQLRGRVGRGEHQSYCILYNKGNSKVAAERMKVMEQTNDGFIISEKDLQLRGPGEFFGTRQHGLPDLKIANLYRDMEILKDAQEAALQIIEEDRLLEKEENRGLKNMIKRRFHERLKDLSFN
jgi:ATP-dependent DNA helicase RecG